MPKTAPVVTEKQWQDVLARLSYLEEQDSQRQDDFYLFQKAVQRVEAKGDDSDQRRRDQLLALQENNVLLLQRFLSCKEEVASNTSDCRRTLDEMREDMEKYKEQMTQFEQRTVKAEERMAAAVCKMKKAKLENKKYAECNQRIIILYKQLHILSKRMSASTRGQLEALNKRLGEHTTSLTTEVKETVGANVLEALQTSTSDSGKLTENDFLHGIRQYGIDYDNSATQAMDDQGDVGWNSKWQEMLSFQKGLFSGVANYLNKSMKTQVKDRDSHHTDLVALETKLNLKFQENYESQLKLMSLNMNRKFEEFGNALIDEVDKRVQENLKKSTETDRKLLGREIDSCNGKDQECRNCGNYRKKELQVVVEKYALKVCCEQKILIQAELDQKLQMHIKSGLGASLNVKKKFEEFRKTLLEDMDKQGQGSLKKQAEMTDKEIEVHEGSVHIVHSPNEKEKQESQDCDKVGQKVLLKDVEKHAREVCNEQKILLQAEIDQKIQMHMKKQSGLGYAWEKRVENLCMDTTQALMNKTIEELTVLIRKTKEELTDLCLSSQNFTTQEINATLEDNVQECSNYLQIEMNDLLVECAKAQTKDLQESVVKESEKIKVSLSESLHQSLVEKIKEVNENQTGFQSEVTNKIEEKIETRVKKLLAEVDRKIECAGECLLKSALSYIDQIIREYGVSHLGMIKKDVEEKQVVKDMVTQQEISWGKGVKVVKDVTQQESSRGKGVQGQVSDESTTQKTLTSTAQPMAGQGFKGIMSLQFQTDSGQTHQDWQQQQQQQQLQLQLQQQQQQQQQQQLQLQQQQQQQQQQQLQLQQQQQQQQQLQLQQQQQGSDSGATSTSSSISAALTAVLTPTMIGKKFDQNEKTISMLRFEAEIYRKIQNATQAAEQQMEAVNSRLAQFQQEMISRAQVMHNNLMRCDAQDRNISSLNLRLRVVEVIVQQQHGGRVQPPTPLIQWN